eukprot:m.14507 g.14507  ORF g.14507 m.14507 type:complete len:422 (+) comp4324_c0_seq1:199-1464(+)
MASLNITKIIRSFHKTPHYDLNFKPISHDFAPTEKQYQEAMIQLAWPMIVAALIFCLWRLIRHCCCERKKKKSSFNDAPDLTCARITFTVLAVVCAAAIAVSFAGNDKLTKSATKLTQHASNAKSLVDRVINATNIVADSSSSLSGFISSTNWSPYGSEVDSQAMEMASELLSSSTTLRGLAQSAGDYDPTDLNDAVLKYDKIRNQATLAFTCFILLLGFISAISICTRKPFFMLVSAFLLTLSFSLCWILGGVELALGVGLSDFCNNPGEYIISEVNNEEVKFIIACPYYPSPFEPQIMEASSYVNASYLLLSDIKNSTGDSFPQIETGILTLDASIKQLGLSLHCEPVHDELIGGIDALCSTGFDGVLSLLFSHTTCGFLLIFAIMILSHIILHTDKDRGYYPGRSLMYEEKTPFFSRD